MDAVVRVDCFDCGHQLGLRADFRQYNGLDADADLFAALHRAALIGKVVPPRADAQDCQAGLNTLPVQRFPARDQLFGDCRRNRRAA